MDDNVDPISQFFSDPDSVDLYDVLLVSRNAKPDEIKKAYRRLALAHHPDKHVTSSDSAKSDASLKFQQIGFAYAVLSDEKRRSRYDKTGKTDEGGGISPGEDGWEAYFEELFDSVTREKLDEDKKQYQGSQEEVEDVKRAYAEMNGSIGEMMNHVPHSTHDDEARFIVMISKLIQDGTLPTLPEWESSTKDEKAKLIRKKQTQKEAKEAENLARELGVWDEFYGSGKAGARKGKGGGKGKGKAAEGGGEAAEEEDHSALQALILKKRKTMDSFFDGLAEKYAELPKGKKGKKRSKAGADEEEEAEQPVKKAKKGHVKMPDIDEEEFAKLQEKLFGDKPKSGEADTTASPRKGRAAAQGRKAR
ncbi:DnaJ-domain-containing protein [Daedalea quercina L-15889]|uniref:DnaJ-domain-containing protein n=1 Tax=Daedalea quercina L-15889 TaxID=1314783 RepID=A0A165Q3Y6_9APHY|nr:DnaJ-domain-containing protein [Daedalea quercina L-15889]